MTTLALPDHTPYSAVTDQPYTIARAQAQRLFSELHTVILIERNGRIGLIPNPALFQFIED